MYKLPFLPLLFRLIRLILVVFIFIDGLRESKIIIGVLVARYFFDRSRQGSNLFKRRALEFKTAEDLEDFLKYSKEEGRWSVITLVADIILVILLLNRLF